MDSAVYHSDSTKFDGFRPRPFRKYKSSRYTKTSGVARQSPTGPVRPYTQWSGHTGRPRMVAGLPCAPAQRCLLSTAYRMRCCALSVCGANRLPSIVQLDWKSLPPPGGDGWRWLTDDWSVDRGRHTDADGWQYAGNWMAALMPWEPSSSTLRLVRRRRHIRLQQLGASDAALDRYRYHVRNAPIAPMWSSASHLDTARQPEAVSGPLQLDRSSAARCEAELQPQLPHTGSAPAAAAAAAAAVQEENELGKAGDEAGLARVWQLPSAPSNQMAPLSIDGPCTVLLDGAPTLAAACWKQRPTVRIWQVRYVVLDAPALKVFDSGEPGRDFHSSALQLENRRCASPSRWLT